jgi:hypothetical protein
MTRSEHLTWCKQRALEYVDEGRVQEAYASMCSDLGKHLEITKHPGIELGLMMLLHGLLSTQDKMRKFILGFN